MGKNAFVNPYNFIPLAKTAPKRSNNKSGNLSGVIEFSLMTRTPLFIPNTSNDHALVKNNHEHKSYDFFSYDDLSPGKGNLNESGTRIGLYSEPVIPGSEVRGMLRSYYEILTNSCMSFVDDEEVSKRINRKKEKYSNSVKDALKEHSPCEDKNNMCPACRLFGILGVSSRLRFADMRAELPRSGEIGMMFHDDVTIKPLGTPKISAMEFYIKRPAKDARFWTYDYYGDSNGNIHDYTPEINGRKFYWHHSEFKIEDSTIDKKDRLNSTIRPIKSGLTFSGKIYFDHLTGKELNELIYTVNAGDSGDILGKRHCYKLGHAKPLGYGSVALHVDNVSIRKIEADDELGAITYGISEYEPDAPDFDKDILSDFRTMTDFEFLTGEKIQYPSVKGKEEIFHWFKQNINERTLIYRQYMKPLSKELEYTGAPQKFRNNNANRNAPKNNQNKRDAFTGKKSFGNKTTSDEGGSYSKRSSGNEKIEVIIDNVLDDGTINFKVNGRTGRIYGAYMPSGEYRPGDKVIVKLYKKSRKYDVYSFVE